jgi:hypothetical protein
MESKHNKAENLSLLKRHAKAKKLKIISKTYIKVVKNRAKDRNDSLV